MNDQIITLTINNAVTIYVKNVAIVVRTDNFSITTEYYEAKDGSIEEDVPFHQDEVSWNEVPESEDNSSDEDEDIDNEGESF